MATSVEQWRKSVPIFPYPSPDPPAYTAHRLFSSSIDYLDLTSVAPPPYDQSSSPVKKLSRKKPRPISQISHVEVDLKKKPYSAITVHVDRLTSEEYEVDDYSGIPDLVEVVRIQDTGPTEAARAIRKKLKYGNMHRQLRSLTILDGLIQNAGSRFQRTFADEPLLERLRLMPRDEMVDSDVRAKCNILYKQWAVAYKNTPGMSNIATLYKQLPRTRKPRPSQSRVVRETEEEAAQEHNSPPSSPAAPPRSSHHLPSASWTPQRQVQLEKTERGSSFFRSSKDKKGKRKPFNLEKETGQILDTIASATVASTNLINALKLINRENQRVSDNPECKNRFDTCKVLRRQILRYIQLVESEKYIGSLLSANDELVKALMAYEVMDKSIDDDSDSDDPEYEAAMAAKRVSGHGDTHEVFQSLSLNENATSPPKPPRPAMHLGKPPPVPTTSFSGKQRMPEPDSEEEDEPEEDDNDPFSDRNAFKTPHVEKNGMTWRDV
ncbi:VHS subgroup [Venturia nashicola]|nr:VHS subgroup [Venturia nashicola]